MNRDHSVIFETTFKYYISDSFDDYDGYSISSKGFLPTVVDIVVIWVKFTHYSPSCYNSLSPHSTWLFSVLSFNILSYLRAMSLCNGCTFQSIQLPWIFLNKQSSSLDFQCSVWILLVTFRGSNQDDCVIVKQESTTENFNIILPG